MKTKRNFYFVLILLGAIIIGLGDKWMKKEYALCIGIVLLMFGVYKTSQSWRAREEDDQK